MNLQKSHQASLSSPQQQLNPSSAIQIPALLCIAHVLPLTNESNSIIKWTQGRTGTFHEKWNLDERNNHLVQLVRNAVLEYFSVRT